MLLRLNSLVVCLHVAVVVDADVFDVVVIFVGSYYRYFGRFCNGVVVTFLHRVLVGCVSVAWITGLNESPECKRRVAPAVACINAYRLTLQLELQPYAGEEIASGLVIALQRIAVIAQRTADQRRFTVEHIVQSHRPGDVIIQLY